MTKRARLNRAPGRRGRRVITAPAATPSAVVHGEQAWADAADASRLGDGAQAIARLAEAEAAFLVAGRADLAARALAQRGVLLAACDQYSDAVICLEKARAELGDWPADKAEDRARYLMAYGESLAAIGDHGEAIRHLSDAMQMLAELGRDVLAAGAALEIASSLMVLGKHDDAAVFCEAAQLGFTTGEEPVLAAYAMRMAARAHEAEGRIHEAVVAHEVAHLNYREAGVHCGAASAAVDQSRLLAEISHLEEDPEASRFAVERLEAILELVDGVNAAHCQHALGRAFTAVGALDHDRAALEAAIPHLVAALDTFISLGLALEAADTADHLSVALRMLGRGDEALMHLGRAVGAAS